MRVFLPDPDVLWVMFLPYARPPESVQVKRILTDTPKHAVYLSSSSRQLQGFILKETQIRGHSSARILAKIADFTMKFGQNSYKSIKLGRSLPTSTVDWIVY